MGFRRWRSGLKNLFLGPEVLDSGEKPLRITRELLEHPEMIGQRQHSHRTARLPLLQHILQHLRTCIRLILERRVRRVQKQYSRNASRGQILGMVGENSCWRGCRGGGAVTNARRNKNGDFLLLAVFFNREVFPPPASDRLSLPVCYDPR